MSFAATGAVAFEDIASDAKVAGSEVKPREDAAFYELGNSTLSFENKVQSCQAKIPIEKQGADSSIFTTYTALLQARIYTSRTDASPTNLSETTFEITLDAPVYEAAEWDQYDEDWYEDIENEFFIMHEEETNADVALSDGTYTTLKQYIWIDTWVNKEYTRPDVLDITFNTEGSSEKLAQGSLVFGYASFAPTSDTSGETQTVVCVTEVGNSENYQILNFKGATDWSDNGVQGQSLDTINEAYATAADDTDNFRESYNEYDYESYNWDNEDGTSTTWSPCKTSLDLPKIGRDSAMFTDYAVSAGVRIYDPTDLTTFETIATTEFTYTLTEPIYEFGDDYEFDERPYEDAVFTEYNDFVLADYISGAEGTGFQKAQGSFKAIPNFETTMWQFKLTLEMPTEYFDYNNYLFQWATYRDTAQTLPATTVSCGMTIGDPYSIEVFEYDDTFDSTVQTDLPAWETNYAAMVEDKAYESSADIEEQYLIETTNSKSKQTCVAKVEIPPEEADFFFDKEY